MKFLVPTFASLAIIACGPKGNDSALKNLATVEQTQHGPATYFLNFDLANDNEFCVRLKTSHYPLPLETYGPFSSTELEASLQSIPNAAAIIPASGALFGLGGGAAAFSIEALAKLFANAKTAADSFETSKNLLTHLKWLKKAELGDIAKGALKPGFITGATLTTIFYLANRAISKDRIEKALSGDEQIASLENDDFVQVLNELKQKSEGRYGCQTK